MKGSMLLERARARLGTDSVVIAAVTGQADRTYNLTVHDERNAAFDWYCSGQTKNAEPGAAACYRVLEHFGRAFEPDCGASLLNREVRASDLRVIHFLVVHQHAAGIDHCHGHLPVALPRFIEGSRRGLLGVLNTDRGAIRDGHLG